MKNYVIAVWRDPPTQEQIDALVEDVQKAVNLICETVDRFAELLKRMIPVAVDAMIEYEAQTGNQERERRWRLVKDTIPRYDSIPRPVLPRARSCC